jgi:hypothetical protein
MAGVAVRAVDECGFVTTLREAGAGAEGLTAKSCPAQ